MSLVNDMLRDLEARRAGASGPGESQVPAGLRRRHGKPWGYLVGAFVLVSGVAVAVTYLLIQPADRNVSAPAESVPPVAEVAPASSSAATLSPIDEWLVRADSALAADQLVRPVDDSVYYYLNRALAIDPSEARARQRLQTLSQRVLDKAEHALERGELGAVSRWLESARLLELNEQDIDTLQARLDGARAAQTEQKAPELAAAQSSVVSSLAREQEPAQTMSATASSAQPATSASESETQTGRVTPTPAVLEKRALTEAKARVREQQLKRAALGLQAFVTAQAREGVWPVQARRFLQALYLQQGETAQAQDVIVPGLPEAQRAYLEAQMFESRGEKARALQALLAGSPEQDDEQYRARVANLYQRLERWPEAEAHYRRLLDVFAPRARYWLGLALALDGQQQYRAAAASYRQAAAANDASSAIREFAAERLAQLNM